MQTIMVHCRIGSLESSLEETPVRTVVHCRIGSLENFAVFSDVNIRVYCRIDSVRNALENICRCSLLQMFY